MIGQEWLDEQDMLTEIHNSRHAEFVERVGQVMLGAMISGTPIDEMDAERIVEDDMLEEMQCE